AWAYHIMAITSNGWQADVDRLVGNKSTDPVDDLANDLVRWELRGWHWHTDAVYLRLMGQAIAISKLPLEQQWGESKDFDDRVKMLVAESLAHRVWNYRGVLGIPGIVKIAEANSRTHAELRCAQVALAAEEFRLKHGRWPESLQELADRM